MKQRTPRKRRLALVIAPGAVKAVELEASWRGPRTGRVAECEVGPPASDGAWPELELGFSFVTNEMRAENADGRADRLLATLHAVLAG